MVHKADKEIEGELGENKIDCALQLEEDRSSNYQDLKRKCWDLRLRLNYLNFLSLLLSFSFGEQKYGNTGNETSFDCVDMSFSRIQRW